MQIILGAKTACTATLTLNSFLSQMLRLFIDVIIGLRGFEWRRCSLIGGDWPFNLKTNIGLNSKNNFSPLIWHIFPMFPRPGNRNSWRVLEKSNRVKSGEWGTANIRKKWLPFIPPSVNCSDPHFSGEGGTIYSTGFFLFSQFCRSIYSSYRILSGINKKHVHPRIWN